MSINMGINMSMHVHAKMDMSPSIITMGVITLTTTAMPKAS